MFKISQSASYTWPVVVEIPVSGGKTERQDFHGEFKRVSQDRIKQIFEEIKEEKITDSDLVKEVLIGWKNIKDDEGKDVDFSDTNLDLAMQNVGFCRAVIEAFFASITGAKVKN